MFAQKWCYPIRDFEVYIVNMVFWPRALDLPLFETSIKQYLRTHSLHGEISLGLIETVYQWKLKDATPMTPKRMSGTLFSNVNNIKMFYKYSASLIIWNTKAICFCPLSIFTNRLCELEVAPKALEHTLGSLVVHVAENLAGGWDYEWRAF